MSNYPVHVAFPGRLIFVGFGSIGQGVLPLILRHVGIQPDQITIVTAEEAGEKIAAEYGVRFVKHPLTRENHKNVLDPIVGRGDFLLNLSVDVSSVALIQLCWEKGALYLDTCIEPWAGATPTRRSRRRAARTTRCARPRSHCARPRPARRRRYSRTAPIRAWCRTSSSRRC
jgi:homospermidine synthase